MTTGVGRPARRVVAFDGAKLIDLDPLAFDSVRLLEPESWLPADAWVDSAYRPYVTEHYSVCVQTEPIPLAQVLDSLPDEASSPFAT